MKIIREILQWTPEWFEMRKGKMTASHATAIGNCWKWLESYIIEMMAESFSSWEREQYSNEHTERWHELEAQARSIYELENDVKVDQVSFIEYNEYIWCSPDGLIWEDWGLEIKCPSDVKFFKMLLDGTEKSIDSDYIWQVQMNLWVTKRKYWDLAFYNCNYEKSLIIFRITPDSEKFAKLEVWFETGIKMIREIQSKFKK